MKKISILFFLALFVIVSCDDDDTVDFSNDLILKMNLLSNSEVINIGDEISLTDNRDLKVLKANMYLSNLKVSNANEEAILDSILFYEIGETDKILMSTDFTGRIEKVNFDVGVDPAWNLNDPTMVDPAHPLGINNSGNHWNWNVGYIFYKFEGMVDNDGDGEFETFFVYHIGKDQFYKNVELDRDIPQVSGATRVLEIGIDVNEMFDNVKFDTENSSHSSGDEIGITQKISDNLSNAIQ